MASVKYGHLTQGFLCERSRGFEDFKQIKEYKKDYGKMKNGKNDTKPAKSKVCL
jgi:hypothetical protein